MNTQYLYVFTDKLVLPFLDFSDNIFYIQAVQRTGDNSCYPSNSCSQTAYIYLKCVTYTKKSFAQCMGGFLKPCVFYLFHVRLQKTRG